jgi:hypothetical protein
MSDWKSLRTVLVLKLSLLYPHSPPSLPPPSLSAPFLPSFLGHSMRELYSSPLESKFCDSLIYFYFLAALVFELRALCLLGSTTSATP